MAGFLYFVPKATAGGPGAVGAVGLRAVLGDRVEWGHIQQGPDGGAGVLMHTPGAGRMAFVPAEQAWAPAPDGRYWVGVELAARPGPKDLEREDRLPGHEVILGDGRPWTVPVGHLFLARSAPVTVMKLGPDGKWRRGQAVEALRPLEEAALEIWKGFHAQLLEAEKEGWRRPAVIVLPDERLSEIAVLALGVNYRLGPVEVSMLDILTSDNVNEVALAVVDWPTIRGLIDVQKKTARAD